MRIRIALFMGLILLLGAACGGGGGGSASVSSDTTSPTIVSVSPMNGTTGVALTETVKVTFSEAIASSTTGSVKLLLGTTEVAGTRSLDASGKIVTFTPSAPLTSNTYTVRVETGIADTAGNHLATESVSTFLTFLPFTVTPPAGKTVYIPKIAIDSVGNTYVFGGFCVTGKGYYPPVNIFLYKFDVTGKIVWERHDTTQGPYGMPMIDLVYRDGFLYVAYFCTDGGSSLSGPLYLEKINAGTGVSIWSVIVLNDVDGAHVAVDASGNVYASTGYGISKYNASGVLEKNLSGVDKSGTLGIVSQGLVNVAVFSGTTPTLYDSNLNKLWSNYISLQLFGVGFATGSGKFFFGGAAVTLSSPFVSTPTVYAYSDTATPQLMWSKTFPSTTYATPSDALQSNLVAISGSGDGYTYIVYTLNQTRSFLLPSYVAKLDPNGNQVWNITAPEFVCACAYGNGHLFLAPYGKGSLYVYDASNGQRIY